MAVVANRISFLVLGYMMQVEHWQCTAEKRLSDSLSGGSKVRRFRETGSGSDGGNISSSKGVC